MDWKPPFKPSTPVGEDGDNIFALGGRAERIARDLRWPEEWRNAFLERISAAPSYVAALDVIREHFRLDGDPP